MSAAVSFASIGLPLLVLRARRKIAAGDILPSGLLVFELTLAAAAYPAQVNNTDLLVSVGAECNTAMQVLTAQVHYCFGIAET
jgi:hypothetical protein